MTRAQWNASIEPQGSLTIGMTVIHIQQALSDGDAALVALILAGTPLTTAQINSRKNVMHGLALYNTANVVNAAALVGTAARNQIVNQGDGYYAVTGAP